MKGSAFSIDASSFLDAWARQYPPDNFPSFWEQMDKAAASGKLKVSEEIVEELAKKDDGASKWINDRPAMIVPTDEEVQRHVRDILKRHPRLVNAGKSRSGGDPFVIAVARIHGCAVITSEIPSNNISKPKIPDVCIPLGVQYVTLLEFIRSQGWKI